MRRRAAVHVAASAAVLLAACSSDSGGAPPADATEGRRLVVQALAWRPGESASRARVARTVAQEAPGVRRVVSRSEGEADFGHNRFRGRQTLVDNTPREIFVADRFQWEREAGGAWDKSPRQGTEADDPVPSPLLGRKRDSGVIAHLPREADRRAIAEALVAGVAPGGTSKQHAVVTRRYRVTLDRDQAEADLDPRLREQMAAWTSNPEGRLEIHLWLDADGRVRKLRWPLASPDAPGVLVIEDEWWDFGKPGQVSYPEDLGDPTVKGGNGKTALTVAGGSVGRLELVDGRAGTTIDDTHIGAYTISVQEGDLGQRRYSWTFRFEIPEEGVRPPARVPALVVRTTDKEPNSIVDENVVDCARPETDATVRELVVDPQRPFRALPGHVHALLPVRSPGPGRAALPFAHLTTDEPRYRPAATGGRLALT